MKKVLFIAIIGIIAQGNLYSQENVDLKEIFLEAEYYLLYEDYPEALALYQKLINNNHENAYINYRVGECYLFIPGQKHKAIPYLEKAGKNISNKVKEGSFKEINAPTKVLFYLGNAYQINNQLEKAIQTYENFKELLDVQDIYNIDYVDQQIKACYNAKELMNKPIKIKEINIGKNINDGFSNIRPIVSSDQKSMVYISELKFYDAILFSKKVGENWTNPINITPDIQSDGDYYTCFLSADGKTLVLLRSQFFMGDIYISKFEDGKFQLPKKLNQNINSKFWETHASLSADGKTIYFASDRKNGYGGLDIYKSTIDEKTNDWGVAVNLGPEINTPFNEETPTITEDGKILFFSSQGHYNMGGFDIFYANAIDENQWSTPINIGYPLNTTDDDLFFYPIENGNIAYISKYDKNGFGQKDIIKVEIFTPDHPFLVNVRGNVILQDKRTDFVKNDFYVDVFDSSHVNFIKKLYLDANKGSFSTKLDPGAYNFVFNSKEYKQKVKNVIIPEDYSREELVFNVELIPLSVITGEYITIRSIYFSFDDFTLSKVAKIELERLFNLMIKYPSLNIEIIGHTDAIGSLNYNKELSVKRAKSTINYLIKKGIDQKRFIAKGAGMDQPLAINVNQDGSDNPEGRKYNRRVEMKILKSDKKIVITGDYNIPEHLRVRDLSYFILLAKEKTELPENYFDKYDELKEYKITKYKNGEFIYTLGNNKEKSELISIFNTVLELGFDDAEIISSYDLESILREN